MMVMVMMVVRNTLCEEGFGAMTTCIDLTIQNIYYADHVSNSIVVRCGSVPYGNMMGGLRQMSGAPRYMYRRIVAQAGGGHNVWCLNI